MTRSPIEIMIDQATGNVPEPVKPLTAQERDLLALIREAEALKPFRHPGDEDFARAAVKQAFDKINYLSPETLKILSSHQRASIRAQIREAIVSLLPRYRAAEAETAMQDEPLCPICEEEKCGCFTADGEMAPGVLT